MAKIIHGVTSYLGRRAQDSLADPRESIVADAEGAGIGSRDVVQPVGDHPPPEVRTLPLARYACTNAQY